MPFGRLTPESGGSESGAGGGNPKTSTLPT